MQVTLHNHVRIGTEEKPVIPNIEFKILCEKARAGNTGYYKEVCEKYSLVPFQHSFVKQIIGNHEKNISPILELGRD